MVAIVGPPASGKSTLAEKLSNGINHKTGIHCSEVVPMDGFHLDNQTLDKLQQRHRKGAAHTFDSKGFVDLVTKLKKATAAVSIPIFDREKDASIANAKTILPEHSILIIEGNYLLLNIQPWSQLKAMFNYSIMLNPGIEIIKKRLIDRWQDNGYDLKGANHRALSNDIPNAEYVLEHSFKADLTIE